MAFRCWGDGKPDLHHRDSLRTFHRNKGLGNTVPDTFSSGEPYAELKLLRESFFTRRNDFTSNADVTPAALFRAGTRLYFSILRIFYEM